MGGKQIRYLGAFLTLCYVALFVQLNWITVFDADDLQTKPGNNRATEREFAEPRGTISTADGVLLAQSVDSNDRFQLQRVYPDETATLFAHITGYFSLTLGSSGVEETYDDELRGEDLGLSLQTINDFFVDEDRIGNLTLTLRNDVQRVAQQALGDQEGSVVALDPRSGEILALWSFPSYDPNQLATHDTQAATLASTALDQDPEKPRLARTYQERFAPGSTFKVVTASAGIESGDVTPDQPDYPTARDYLAPGTTNPVGNFGNELCGGTLFTILAVSCNSAFSQMGVEDATPEGMIERAHAYGFDQDVPIDLPDPIRSVYPDQDTDRGLTALRAIGQEEVAATPLQMALVAAAVANGGEIRTPHVLKEIRDGDGEVVKTGDDDVWTEAISPGTANLLRQAMIGVVQDGTAENLDNDLSGFEVGGKTGTAQLGTDPPRSHAWIIGFAGPPGEDPEVVVAVIVQGTEGSDDEATGGRVAAPIASQVMAAALAEPQPAQQDSNEAGG
jgi:peptidoglycan glycosyltransferase